MDYQRDPAILTRTRRLRLIVAAFAVVILGAVGVGVSRLGSAPPTVTEGSLWVRTVRRGPLVREVRGAGTLVPEDLRWIPATTSGRVSRIVLRPGAPLQPGTVILELDNPDLRQQLTSAALDLQTAVAQLAQQRASLTNAVLAQESAVVDADSSYHLALTDLELNRALAAEGLVAEFTIRQKQVVADQLKNRLDLARKQLQAAKDNGPLQLAPAEAAVNQRRADVDRVSRQLDDLRVKSPITGQLQLVSVEEGQQIGPGTNLVRVSDPRHLKAAIRIAETQVKDVRVGQNVDIDTRNGHVPGRVVRIDPASAGGTVGVDVTLEGPLPAGARPDVSIDGTVELERLASVLFIENSGAGQEPGTLSLFKLLPSGDAVRTTVRLGRRSVQFVEVVDGLADGDRVILSDMSSFDAFDRVKVR
jgi:HlyD family secretion protein